MQTLAEIDSFLDDAGWREAKRQSLAADWSSRRFYRLTKEGLAKDEGAPRTAIFMRAGPEQKTESFVHLSALLRRIEIAAPEVYASDIVRGMALLQDFGDQNAGKMLDAGGSRDFIDAQAAVLLAQLHKTFDQRMLGAFKSPLYSAALFSDQVTAFLDHYYPRVFHRAASARERSNFVDAWHSVLAPLDTLPRSLLLRDFMPDNMMVLSTPIFGSSGGLLDFQDAGLGCIAYDMASWCEEVRRDGGLARLESFVTLYCTQNADVDPLALLSAARVYAAQRHTRILGQLVKLDRTELIPRVWKALQSLLKHDELAPVRRWFASCQPPS